MKTDLFQSCGHCWVFQICWHTGCITLTASSFRFLNGSAEILPPALVLFIVMLVKVPFDFTVQISCSRWVTTPLWSLRPFLYSSSVYFCHLLLLLLMLGPYCLSFILPILTWNVLLIPPIFLKRSVFLCLHWSFKKAFFNLLAILCNSAFSWVYLSLSPLPFTSLQCLAICKPFSENHFAFLHFFFFGMVLVTASCTILWSSSIVLQAFSLPDLIPWMYPLPSLYNHKGFDLGHTWMA